MNTVLLSNLFSLPRIVYAMAEDGLFFRVFSRVHPRTQVPVIGIVVFGLLMALLALVFDLEALVQFLSIGTLLAYTFVAASIIVLRFQQQKVDAPAPTAGGRPSPEPREGPSAGELKEYESFSDKLQLVDRDKSKEHREPGQLKAAFEPYLEFLSDFYPGEVVTVAVVTLMVSAVCLCSILVFGNTHLHLPTWSYSLLLVLFSLGFLLSLLLIWAHEQQRGTQTFQVCLGAQAGLVPLPGLGGGRGSDGPMGGPHHPALVKATQLLEEEEGVSKHWVWGGGGACSVTARSQVPGRGHPQQLPVDRSSASPQPPAPLLPIPTPASALCLSCAAELFSSASASLLCLLYSPSPVSSLSGPRCGAAVWMVTPSPCRAPALASPARTTLALGCAGGLFGPCAGASGLFPEPAATPPARCAAWHPAPGCQTGYPSSWLPFAREQSHLLKAQGDSHFVPRVDQCWLLSLWF